MENKGWATDEELVDYFAIGQCTPGIIAVNTATFVGQNDAVETLSDHRDLSFGTAYGVAIKELRLLSRAVFVICANGVIAYEQIVKEVTHDVDFEAALGAVKACLEK